MNSREGHRKSGDFNVSGEFGDNGEFISRKPEARAKFRQIRHSCRIRRIRQNRHFVGTLLSSSFALISIFGEISSNSSFSPNSPDSSKSLLCRYPSLELIRSNLDFWRNFVKFAILVIACISHLIPYAHAYVRETL